MMIRIAALLLAGLATTCQAQQERGPVAQWTFNGPVRLMVPDVSGHGHDAYEHPLSTYAPSPGGRAMVFNGRDVFLSVPSHSDLTMSDRVTLDCWLMVDDPERGEPGCIVEKGGERYRLQVSGTSPAFGMKGDSHSFWLGGGQLTAGQWHRLTATFDRPVARLYVDGELVKEDQCEKEMGPGRNLYIGSKAGVTFMFAGKIDELRIYDYARPPRPEDALVTDIPEPTGAPAVQPRLEVTAVQGGVSVDTGAARFELSDDGALRSAEAAGKAVVANNTEPLVAMDLFESASYDGRVDLAPGRIIEGVWRCQAHEEKHDDRTCTVSWTGRVAFPGGDEIECALQAQAERGSPFLTVTATLTPRGEFRDRFIRSAELRLPLALNKRKRIVQAGDRGVQWNTRHWFQFHANSLQRLLTEPEHNIWRRFVIDQNTPVDYHIWRAESTATASLSMQRGLQAPGWMSVYDERAGLLLSYRDFAARAPKSLRVEADGSGAARVCLWHEGLPGLDVRSPQADALFGRPHVTDWMVYPDEFIYLKPDQDLARHWGVQSLSSDTPPRNELPLPDLNLFDAPAADDAGPMVAGGVPLPRGAVNDPGNVRLRRDGRDVPLQTRALGYWPDHSIKWLLLIFPPDGGEVAGASGAGDELSFDLTRRDHDADRYTLQFGGDTRPGRSTRQLTATIADDVVTVDTGPLRLEVAKAPGWLRSARLNGRELLAGGGASFVDFLRTERNAYPSMTSLAQGTADDGGFVPETIELEEAGPLRAVVRLTGHTTAQDSPRMVLRLEAYAGRSVARVFQSFEFLHKEPREALVRRMGLRLPLTGAGAATLTAGGEKGALTLGEGERGGLRQHSHLGYTAWRQVAGERFVREDQVANRSRAWLDMAGPQGGVAMVMRDMWQSFPAEIVADRHDGSLTAFFWPESEPPMDVRRYSNYPHRSQGESAGTSSDWVETSWYPRDPVVGVTRTHELLLVFHAPDLPAARIDSIAADFQRRPLVYCGAQWYHDTQVAPPYTVPDPERFARADANLEHFARFLNHHQELWGWYGLWDYGDVRHYWRGGAGMRVPAADLTRILADPPEDLETVDVSRMAVPDFAANHDWDYDNGRWGWSNTEGLPNYLLQTQYLRTGDRDLFFFIEAMARHVRDVDMRHDGMWLGRGTRHGVQHWSDGNHEERQTTHSEFRYHYYLAGEHRSRDFANRLFERVYSQTDVRVHAAHSGRMQGLLTYWEMTGSDQVADILRRYVPCFIVPEGLCEQPDVDFPDVVCRAQTDYVNAGNMFFWLFGASHGLMEYADLTDDEELRQAFIRFADAFIARRSMGIGTAAVAFAALYADDPAPYREALDYWRLHENLLQHLAHNPEFYAGPRAFVRGGVTAGTMVLIDVPFIMRAIGSEGTPDESRQALMDDLDANGGPYYQAPYLSWQSEYDIPELTEYLRIKHPQP